MPMMATTPESARAYLAEMLAKARISKAHASRAIGRNHAYIKQYLDGKPLWLGEVERERLVKMIDGLDPTRLREPVGDIQPGSDPNRPRRQREDQTQIDLPRLSELIEKPGALDLLRIYGSIRRESLRKLVLETARQTLAADSAEAA